MCVSLPFPSSSVIPCLSKYCLLVGQPWRVNGSKGQGLDWCLSVNYWSHVWQKITFWWLQRRWAGVLEILLGVHCGVLEHFSCSESVWYCTNLSSSMRSEWQLWRLWFLCPQHRHCLSSSSESLLTALVMTWKCFLLPCAHLLPWQVTLQRPLPIPSFLSQDQQHSHGSGGDHCLHRSAEVCSATAVL